MVDKVKRFNSDKVPMSHHLVSLSDKQKARLRKANGVKSRFASDVERVEVLNPEREYFSPWKKGYAIKRVRGRSGRGLVGLSHAKRLMVLEKAEARDKFIASLSAS